MPIISITKVPRILEILVKGRIRCMTAITLTYAHAYQTTCLARHMPADSRQNFRLTQLIARYSYLPNARSITHQRGNDYREYAIYTHGGETLAGWCVISRSSHGRIDFMFGLVVTTEAPLAFSGTRTHSKQHSRNDYND